MLYPPLALLLLGYPSTLGRKRRPRYCAYKSAGQAGQRQSPKGRRQAEDPPSRQTQPPARLRRPERYVSCYFLLFFLYLSLVLRGIIPKGAVKPRARMSETSSATGAPKNRLLSPVAARGRTGTLLCSSGCSRMQSTDTDL